ncbi:MAG: glycoside hydrolase family 127 protein [Candidatus Heimdallarchaeaceae archaeon]
MESNHSPYSKLKEVNFSKIKITDNFWKMKQNINRNRAIFHQWKQLEKSGTIDNFRYVSEDKEGFRTGYFYTDSDSHKWAEAASLILVNTKSNKLEKLLEDYFNLILKVQEDDGYVFTYNQFHFPEQRWVNFQIEHELYSLGHLIEAACAFYSATGNQRILEIGEKAAKLVINDLSDLTTEHTPGHPEIEIALIKLFRITYKKYYLEIAEKILEKRGRMKFYALQILKENFSQSKRSKLVEKQRKAAFTDKLVDDTKIMSDISKEGPPGLFIRAYLQFLSGKYFQQNVPIRKLSKPIGHSVRWGYLATSITMLYQEMGDESLLNTLEESWDYMVCKRMYVTGGIGSLPLLEGFGRDYELNNKYAYNETCAAISSIFWSWEMLLATGQAKYADLIEWQLYNAFLVGMSSDGTTYFYRNPLETRGNFVRKSWYKTACCPSNISRTLAKLGQYIYSINDFTLWIHQYIGSSFNYDFEDGKTISVSMKSGFPWKGSVKITIENGSEKKLDIKLRIPSWTRKAIILVNGKEENIPKFCELDESTASGYSPYDSYYLPVELEAGKSEIEMSLPMETFLRKSDRKVKCNRGKIALTRGPLVYCFESIDNLDSDVPDSRMRSSITIKQLVSDSEDKLVTLKINESSGRILKAIPYFSWGNRGKSAMQVWINFEE